MDSDCSSCALTCASPTTTFGRSPSTRFHEDTCAQTIVSDYIFIRAALKNVLHTRSYHSADGNTDHSLVCCKIRLQPKRFHRTEKQGNAVLMSPNLCCNLRRLLRERDRCPTVQRLCHREVGNSPRHLAPHNPHYLRENTPKTHDWFDAKSTEITPVIEAKRTTVNEYKLSHSERNVQILRAARSKVRQTHNCVVVQCSFTRVCQGVSNKMLGAHYNSCDVSSF